MALLYGSRGLRLVSARYGAEGLPTLVSRQITEEIFKFRVPLDCEWKSELNWKETH